MRTFDDIQIRRPDLAKSYLQLLRAQPGRPLALFASRRVGKTFFLDHDLTPAAREEGLLPVYADLWLQRAAPLDAVNHAFEEALDEVSVPKSGTGKLAKTAVKKVGALGVSLDLGETPARRALPSAAELRLDALTVRLAEASGKPILLMLDEVQALGDATNGESIMAALRAVLHKRRDIVWAVFTGSSQQALARMLSTVGAPMYQFTQLMDFPVLGDEYLRALSDHFSQVHRERRPLLDDLRRVFVQLGFKPALMKDLVKAMSAEGVTDVDMGLKQLLQDERYVAGWRGLLQTHDAFDRAVLLAIAAGAAPMGQETLAALAGSTGRKATVSKVRAAVERLRRTGILSKVGRGDTVIDDPLFAQYLRGKTLDQLRY